MNKQTCVAISLLLTVSACAYAPPYVDTQDIENCQDTDTVTISLRAVRPNAAPPHVCVTPGTQLKFRLVPRQDANTLLVLAKTTNIDGGGPGNWLSRSNTSGAEIMTVTVPNRAYMIDVCGESEYNNGNCYFDYAIFAKAKLPVDPRVTVKR